MAYVCKVKIQKAGSSKPRHPVGKSSKMSERGHSEMDTMQEVLKCITTDDIKKQENAAIAERLGSRGGADEKINIIVGFIAGQILAAMEGHIQRDENPALDEYNEKTIETILKNGSADKEGDIYTHFMPICNNAYRAGYLAALQDMKDEILPL